MKNLTNRNLFILATGFFVLLAPGFVWAQTPATSFEQLLVKRGETVTVVDGQGNSNRGKITDLSPTTLSLQVTGTIRSFHQADVSEIRQLRSDSLRTGLIIGAAVGAGCGIPLLGECAGCDWGGKALTIGLTSGIGAGIGMGLDALIQKSVTIFRASSSANRIRITPLLLSQHKGIALSVSF